LGTTVVDDVELVVEGDRFERQVGDQSQHEQVPLIGGQLAQGGDQHRIHRLRMRGGGPVKYRLCRHARTASPPTGVVDDAVAGDGEHPPAHGEVVVYHPMHVTGDLDEHLAQDVLGIGTRCDCS
jgi:hypothetical protein